MAMLLFVVAATATTTATHYSYTAATQHSWTSDRLELEPIVLLKLPIIL